MPSSNSVRFSQSCPTCGRRVEIRATLLGHDVACRHCTAQFVATASDDQHRAVDEQHQLMARVERALELGGNSSVA